MKKLLVLLALNVCISHLHALTPDSLKKQQEIENEVNEYMSSLEEEAEILKNKPNFMMQLENSCKALFTKAQQAKQECKVKGQDDISLCSQYAIANKKYREYKELLLFLKYGIDIKAHNAGGIASMIVMSAMQEMGEAIEEQKKTHPTYSAKKPNQLFPTDQ